jgi:hypothetical protein
MEELLKAIKDFEQLAIQVSLTLSHVIAAVVVAVFAISGALRICRDELKQWQSHKAHTFKQNNSR